MLTVVKSRLAEQSRILATPGLIAQDHSSLYWREQGEQPHSPETYAEYIFDRAELLIVQEKTILCIFTKKGGK
jgi:hypothetical protein